MLYTILSIAFVIAAIFIYGAVFRRKIYKEVDRMEQWKTEIANRPVADEISRVKGLTISGETEEKFEAWRKDWDEILGLHLPDIDEALFDIEEWANKYRFRKSKELINVVAKQLQEIDEKIQEIFKEVHELIHNEEENRSGISDTKEKFEEMQRFVSQSWRSLGDAAPSFEKSLKQMKDEFEQFEEETVQGNYMKANKILQDLQLEMAAEEEKMKIVPALLVEIEADLPEDCRDLEKGMEDMEKSGYSMEQFAFRKQIDQYRSELPALSKMVTDLEISKAEDKIKEIRSFIENVYETLEDEVAARQFVELAAMETKQDLDRMEIQLRELNMERTKVGVSYRIPDEELRRQDKIEHDADKNNKNWRVFQDMHEHKKQSFISLKKTIEPLRKDVASLEKDIRSSKEKLYNLRKDELKALDTLTNLRKQLLHDRTRLQRAMLPKVPSSLLNEIDAASASIEEAAVSLEEVPVEMGRVTHSVENSEQNVNKVHQQLKTTLDQAELAEDVIQYGNKFRSSSRNVDAALTEAENYFRKGYYDEAVNTALQVIKQKDPDVLENLKLMKEPSMLK
ncbi:septation ring formation regulator EzrA [Alteribacillus sp. HJP-4]|uniref:septation ring formation regulator EzrA n=1 Tax=Alteribacillus sp. HJP-4 TaxID=2775394 RepID=UPI0035CCE653